MRGMTAQSGQGMFESIFSIACLLLILFLAFTYFQNSLPPSHPIPPPPLLCSHLYQIDAGNVSGLWHFDEGNGSSVRDDSGNRNSGVLAGGVRWLTGASCKSGACLAFSGRDSKVRVTGSEGLLPLEGVTVGAWVRPDDGVSSGGIFEKTVGGKPSSSFSLYIEDGIPRFRVVSGVNSFTARSSSRVHPFQWVFIAGSFDGKDVSVWMDGVKTGSSPVASRFLETGAGPSFIGVLANGIFPFSGAIDELVVYKRGFADEEMLHEARCII